ADRRGDRVERPQRTGARSGLGRAPGAVGGRPGPGGPVRQRQGARRDDSPRRHAAPREPFVATPRADDRPGGGAHPREEALAYGGMLGYTQTSGQLMNWGVPGPGHWLTIYANEGHVFMYVAGLRFDTSGRAGDHASRWQLAPRTANGFVARHYPGL